MAIPPILRSALAPDYDLREEIGRGGMATVYSAVDPASGEIVAIKVLDPELASSLDPKRFLREIRIASELDHPNILPVLRSGEAGGFLFYVMPLVDGEPLRARIDRKSQLGVEESIRIATPLAAALDYAHDRNVVHRDVNPANVLLSGSGEVFLSDFGIARTLSRPGGDKVTATGHMVGTPAYSSPEQSEAAREVDRRADVYSLGCVIHEMLAGQPPFVGKTAQAITAQHLGAPPPSLDAIRPGLPPAIAPAVTKALAKVPADRFDTATGLVAAMVAPRAPMPRRQRYAWLTAAALVAAALATAPLWDGAPMVPLDPNKVLVFPLAATSAIADPSAGWDAALAIGAALEHAEPLRFIDGFTWLSEDLRSDPGGVTAEVAAALSRARGAAFYVSGAIRASGGAASVIVRLYDVAGDSIVVQETEDAGGTADALPRAALAAITRVLPRLVDPARPADLTALTDRSPAATALFLQGERAYRQSYFGEAADLYQRALEEDPDHAFAAIKGASAADWDSRFEDARNLVASALSSPTALPPKYRAYALGLQAYFEGDSEGAREHLAEAVTLDGDWAEAAAAMGEVHFHLLPGDTPDTDSASAYWFEAARAADSTFGPPLYHLTQIALRRGDVQASSRSIDLWRGFEPNPIELEEVELALACLLDPEAFDWTTHLGTSARPVLTAGTTLSRRASQPGCASGALRAVFESDLPANTWGARALVGLHGLALAQGRYEAARLLLRQGIEKGIAYAHMYFTYAASAGAPFESEADAAEQIMRDALGDTYGRVDAEYPWLMGVWLTVRGDVTQAEAVASVLAARAEEEGDRAAARLARSLQAHVHAARGELAEAIELLQSITPDAPRGPLVQSLWEPAGLDRLLLAELLLRENRPAEAHHSASLIDQTAPLSYLPLVARSLVVRAEAASVMDRPDLVSKALSRLHGLGWAGPEAVPPSPLIKE